MPPVTQGLGMAGECEQECRKYLSSKLIVVQVQDSRGWTFGRDLGYFECDQQCGKARHPHSQLSPRWPVSPASRDDRTTWRELFPGCTALRKNTSLYHGVIARVPNIMSLDGMRPDQHLWQLRLR